MGLSCYSIRMLVKSKGKTDRTICRCFFKQHELLLSRLTILVKLKSFNISSKGSFQLSAWNNCLKFPNVRRSGIVSIAIARQKALHYSQFSEWLILADDSGLEVDALGGLPWSPFRPFSRRISQ